MIPVSTNSAAPAAVVLLSGGLDSTTVLAHATAAGYHCHCLSFAYGQRHRHELELARQNAARWGAARHLVLNIQLDAIGGSALTSPELAVPKTAAIVQPGRTFERSAQLKYPASAAPGGLPESAAGLNDYSPLAPQLVNPCEPFPEDQAAPEIPVTYVPGRNTIFLAYAASWAEVLGARDIFIGVNAVDFSGYPDCRPDYLAAMEATLNMGSKSGREGKPFRLQAPLLELSKAEIIARGLALGVDYSQTHSCYDPDPSHRACGRCDACILRRRGFAALGRLDPIPYQTEA